MKLKKYIKYLVLLIPVIFFVGGNKMEMVKFHNDPNYVYLVNATGICIGKSVKYIDHPGTTVMQIGAVTIALKHIIDNPENVSLTNHVFGNPHSFIVSIKFVLLLLNTLVLFFLGWFALKKTGQLWLTILLQSVAFLNSNMLEHVWTKISPEPFLFFLTNVFVIVILSFYTSKKKNSWKYVVFFALISGAGLATKATFLPLIFAPVIFIPSLKRKVIYSLLIIPSFVLFTLPIIPQYETLYFWFRDLIGHSGIYGQGEEGLINLNTYFPNLIAIFSNNPVFVFVLLAGTIITIFLFLTKKNALSVETRILLGLVSSGVFGVLLVAKHYHANHYLIPVLLLVGLILFFSLRAIEGTTNRKTIHKFVLPILALAFLIFTGLKVPQQLKYANEGYKLTNLEMDSTHQMIKEKFQDYTKIYYYPMSISIYSALNFGDVYASREMLPYIKAIYGDIYFFHEYEKVVKNWNEEIDSKNFIEENDQKILLVGGPRNEDIAADMWKYGLPLIQIYKGRLQAIYQLDSTRYNQLKDTSENVITQEVFCGFEQINNNGYFLGSNLQVFGNAATRDSTLARSGSYSVKTDETTEFAMEYFHRDIEAGTIFDVKIWRYKGSNARLVVAAEDSDLFYRSQNWPAEMDENGWELIRLSFSVPDDLDGKNLKIYLWNSDGEVAYFDDFSIRAINY